MNNTNINVETYVIDGKHAVDAIINKEEKTIQCKMYTEHFCVDFYSEKFLSDEDVDYFKKIIEETKIFLPKFEELEKQYLKSKDAD